MPTFNKNKIPTCNKYITPTILSLFHLRDASIMLYMYYCSSNQFPLFVGHTAQVLSMVSVSDNAPLVSLLARGLIATVVACIGDLSSLVNFFSFCTWLFYFMVFTAQILLRRRGYHADDKQVFRVPLLLPVMMLIVSVYLIVVPIASDPQLPFLFAALFMLSGLVFYFPFVYKKKRVRWFEKVSRVVQILLKVNIPDKRI